MWNANDDNEWRRKLEYARLRLKLREHAPESITFKESWPGKNFKYSLQDIREIAEAPIVLIRDTVETKTPVFDIRDFQYRISYSFNSPVSGLVFVQYVSV